VVRLPYWWRCVTLGGQLPAAAPAVYRQVQKYASKRDALWSMGTLGPSRGSC